MKNILEYNNNTLKSDFTKRKFLLYTIVASIYFIIIYLVMFTTFQQQIFVGVNAGKSDQNATSKFNLNCAVVIDAGCTESIVLTAGFYKTTIDTTSLLRKLSCTGSSEKSSYFNLKNYTQKRTEGGLSQYINHIQKREEIIRSLLEEAKDLMTKNPDCGKTPLIFRATDDLNLSNKKADEIINQVKIIVNEYRPVFQVDDNSVAIMDGGDKGLFAWLTVNYLLDTLKDFNNTTAVLDLGGGSLQITHHLPNYNKVNCPYKEKYIKERSISGVKRYFYTQSYLGFGLIGARTKIFKTKNDEKVFTTLCYHKSRTFSFKFNSILYIVLGNNESTDGFEIYMKCREAIQSIIDETVTAVQNVNSFNVTAISFFYDQAVNANIIDDMSTIPINRFVDAAKNCFSKEFDESNPFKCVDLLYIYLVLRQGFGFPDTFSISFQKYINNIELNWTLGAAYDNLIGKVET